VCSKQLGEGRGDASFYRLAFKQSASHFAPARVPSGRLGLAAPPLIARDRRPHKISFKNVAHCARSRIPRQSDETWKFSENFKGVGKL
jgi:hypothetical protein